MVCGASRRHPPPTALVEGAVLPPFLALGIFTSAVGHLRVRQLLRATMLSSVKEGPEAGAVEAGFVLGSEPCARTRDMEAEARRYGDVWFIDAPDCHKALVPEKYHS